MIFLFKIICMIICISVCFAKDDRLKDLLLIIGGILVAIYIFILPFMEA